MPDSMMVNSRSKKLWRSFREPSAIPKSQSPIRGARRVLSRTQKQITSDDSALTLENLPSLILDWIFEYVRSSHLARIAGLSRDLYWPIVSRIYRSIAFVRDSEIAEETDWSNESVINYYTAIPKHKMKTFVESLQNNPSLRDLVQSVNLSCDIPAELADTLFGMLTNVKAYCAQSPYSGVNKIRSKLEKLIIYIFRAPPLLSYLVELRIVGPTAVFEKEEYQTLARDLCQSRGHLRLRKLHLATCSLVRIGSRPPVIGHPHWCTFLDELIAHKVTLRLTALGLYGVIETFAQATIHKLRRCLYLGEVHTLVLSIEPDHASGDTVLERITKITPQLNNLAIHSMWNRSTSPPSAICDVLKNNIPNQLKALLISYPYDGDLRIANIFRENIQKAILKSQRNLVKLKIDGRRWLLHQTGWSERGRQVVQDSFNQDLSRELQQKDFSRIFENPHVYPRLSKTSVKLVKRHITKIRDAMKTDLICANAATDLPFLTHYVIDMLVFDLKQGGVLVNDEVILVDPLSAAHLLWRLHGVSLKWNRFVSYVKKRR